MASAPGLQDSLVTGYRRLASDAPHRRIDFELRFLDVVVAVITGVGSLPLGLIIAAILRVTSGSPVLYRGERVGRHGVFFQMLKFRTLRRGAEQRIGQYLGEELVRQTEVELTSLGRWLKASQLDEIPQVWNVLRGDMSFVGPRPIRPRFFAELATDLPAYWQRLVVRPGLTGFAQVRRRLRDVDGGEARARPRVDRRPLRFPVLRTLVVTAFRVLRQPCRSRLRLARMCGICGIAGTADPERLRRMSETLVHRGPDSEGFHVDGVIGLAARRLAIMISRMATSR